MKSFVTSLAFSLLGLLHNTETSPTFSNLEIIQIIPQFMQRAKEVGVSQTLEEFEAFIRSDRTPPLDNSAIAFYPLPIHIQQPRSHKPIHPIFEISYICLLL